MQEALVYISLFVAVIYLARKFVFKSKNKDDCGTDCNC